MEVQEKLAVLAKIARAFHQEKITWAVGASLLLYCKGIVQNFHDIDIVIAEADAEKAKQSLLSMGTLLPANPNVQYKTKMFLEFVVDGVEIDIMAGFAIVHDGKTSYFSLEKDAIHDFTCIDGAQIPLQSVAEWRMYYALMGRTEKVRLIDACATSIIVS